MHQAVTVAGPRDIDELRGIGLFGGLNDSALVMIAAHLHETYRAAGECIFAEGEPGCSLYVVLSGVVELTKLASPEHAAAHGATASIATIEAGMWFGEVAMLGVTCRAITARAAEPCRLLELHARALRALSKSDMKQYALLLMNLAREIARKLQLVEQRMASAAMPPVQ